MQSACFQSAYATDDSLIVAAPTGSGKTGVLELGLARLFGGGGNGGGSGDIRGGRGALAVYMAPLKALTHERLIDWKAKLSTLNVVEVTGDSDDASDERAVAGADLVLTTPEKFDAFTRFRRDASGVIGRLGLLLVDEVHMLGDPDRGSTLEAVITRLRTIAQSEQVTSMPISKLRIFAASATVSNVEDVAAWFGPRTIVKRFDESYRPVPLQWRVLTYPMAQTFTFDKYLSQKLFQVVREHASRRPTLVFCNSRKVCKEAAQQVANSAGMALLHNAQHQQRLQQAASSLADKQLAGLVRCAIGFHDASLIVEDKRAIEGLFADGTLLVLCCSSSGGYEEYTRIETMQMAGRAGRPQFDDTGVCVVMTRDDMKSRYERMLGGTETIESHLHEHQLTHLNAEIASAGSHMSDIVVCLRWLKSTFLSIRMQANPSHYKLTQKIDANSLDSHLKSLLVRNLHKLAAHGMIRQADDGLGVQPLLLGTIMARFCIAFDTMCSFPQVDGSSNLESVVGLLAHASEFTGPMYLRNTDKKPLFAINTSKNIRFPLMDGKKKSKIKTAAMKASLLLQLRAGGHNLNEFHAAEYTILQSGGRILNGLVEYLTREEKHANALRAESNLRPIQIALEFPPRPRQCRFFVFSSQFAAAQAAAAARGRTARS